MKRLPIIFCLFFVKLTLFSQNFWTPIAENTIAPVGEKILHPKAYATFSLNSTALESFLAAAPERFSAASETEQITLAVPMPDGTFRRFRMLETPAMHPDLQAQFPQIRCYLGIGIDDPMARLRCDFTQLGFHAMLRSPRHGMVFIEPYTLGDRAHYMVYYKKDNPSAQQFECDVRHLEDAKEDSAMQPLAEQGDCQFRKYRMAFACTGEYAAVFGGTTAGALSAITTTVNRLNDVYEVDFGVTLELIANNNLIVYLNGMTDPYTNGDEGIMIDQNRTNCNSVIGSANYDIGHVAGTGGGGVAYSPCVCSNSFKAGGATLGSPPSGDAFDIDYVAHEVGHQFNGSHTQNNDCNRDPAASMEPGSASTIMGYAGICAPNIQMNSDPYFHAISLQEVANFITPVGHSCDVILSTANSAPTVNAGADYTIPYSTPFALTATASDANGDAMTYCWEQYDPEVGAAMPPASTNLQGPMFRSLSPDGSPTRYFPQLSSVLSGANGNTWEVLPSVGRTMLFRVTVRDNNATYGCTKEDDVTITVAGGAGPFAVTAPNTAVSWAGNSTQTISWDVNSTNAAPVSCANVKVTLSTDGGNTFPLTLAVSTPNDGSQALSIPNVTSSNCRVKIEAATGNVFYDISNSNFTITAVAPVELIDFQAKRQINNDVLLTWETASESNNEGFEIQMRGEQAADFQTVGFVPGKGNSTVRQQYRHTISNPGKGTFFFRLKQVDFDGKSEYSPLRALTLEHPFGLQFSPNPAQDELLVRVFAESENLARFALFNQLGQLVFEQNNIELVRGDNALRLDLGNLPSGVYYTLWEMPDGRQEGKLAVQKEP
jgi:hypothetical protein